MNVKRNIDCSDSLQGIGDPDAEEYIPSIAIVGRPNVGKSSIVNALVGENRTIVSPISGTTRDAIDTEFTGSDGQVGEWIALSNVMSYTPFCINMIMILCTSNSVIFPQPNINISFSVLTFECS